MASSLKPIKLYGAPESPNPFKAALILAELNLPVEVDAIPFTDVKQPSYLAINPNGRLPAIHDPNTGLTLWESGAIIEYLIDTYDKEHRLSFKPGSNEHYLAKQMLHFQMSGQGPYYGQAVFFKVYHPERVQSAIDRYINEIRRVNGVLESMLQGKQWLVGGKMSYADLAFVPWQNTARNVLADEGFDADEFPGVKAWVARMNERESVKGLFSDKMRDPEVKSADGRGH